MSIGKETALRMSSQATMGHPIMDGQEVLSHTDHDMNLLLKEPVIGKGQGIDSTRTGVMEAIRGDTGTEVSQCFLVVVGKCIFK